MHDTIVPVTASLTCCRAALRPISADGRRRWNGRLKRMMERKESSSLPAETGSSAVITTKQTLHHLTLTSGIFFNIKKKSKQPNNITVLNNLIREGKDVNRT